VEDGPAKTLLKYMEGTDFIAPSSWRGHRALSSK